MKLDHVGVVVNDTDTSLEFYTKVLGAKLVDSHQDERVRLSFLEIGGQIIELVQYLGQINPRDKGPVDHIAFRVGDLESALDKIRAVGAPLLLPEPRRIGNKKIMFFGGPDGERLEFVQVIE